MHYRTLALEKKNGMAILTLNRPETLNAINLDMSEETADAVNELSHEAATKVVVITGAGNGFCAGIDVRKLLARTAEGGAETTFEGAMQGKSTVLTVPVRLRSMGKPVIGAINGIAAGSGFSIALACDVRIASERAKFSMAFILRGLIPDCGGTFFLPKLIGSAKACELVFTGDTINAEEAKRLGLVNSVVPQEKLMEAAEELADRLLRRPATALKYAKRAVYKGLVESDLSSHLDYEIAINRMCTDSDDFKEAVKSFLEKNGTIRGK